MKIILDVSRLTIFSTRFSKPKHELPFRFCFTEGELKVVKQLNLYNGKSSKVWKERLLAK